MTIANKLTLASGAFTSLNSISPIPLSGLPRDLWARRWILLTTFSFTPFCAPPLHLRFPFSLSETIRGSRNQDPPAVSACESTEFCRVFAASRPVQCINRIPRYLLMRESLCIVVVTNKYLQIPFRNCPLHNGAVAKLGGTCIRDASLPTERRSVASGSAASRLNASKALAHSSG